MLYKSISFNVWVRYFVWNFKWYLCNSTQNILPIHWEMWILLTCENLRALRFKNSQVFLIHPRAHLTYCLGSRENGLSQWENTKDITYVRHFSLIETDSAWFYTCTQFAARCRTSRHSQSLWGKLFAKIFIPHFPLRHQSNFTKLSLFDFVIALDVHSLRPSDACMSWQTRAPLVQIMACRLFGAKPQPEPMMTYCQLNHRSNFSEILFAIQTFSLNKMHFKLSSAKWRPFCLGLNVLRYSCETTWASHRLFEAYPSG